MYLRDSLIEQGVRKGPSSRKGKDAMSLALRIASSASGLAKNVIGSSIANDLPNAGSSGPGMGSKISNASSSAITSHWLEVLPVRSDRSSTYGHPESSNASFRSSPGEEAQNQDFEEFMGPRNSFYHDVEETTCNPFMEDFSPKEQRIAHRMKSALPPAPEHQVICPQSPRNLKPAWQAETYIQDPPQSTFDWTAVLKHYVEDVWGPEKFTAAHLEGFQQGDIPSLLAGPDQLDEQALSRLKMILGHVTETAHSALSSRQYHSFSQVPPETISQERFAISCASPSHSDLEQMSHISDPATPHMFHRDHATANGQREAHKPHHQPVRRDSPMADQDMNEELPVPTFHCPWIRCHQRFNNAMEFRLHTNGHSEYQCPHEHCDAQFLRHEEWADHITGPHHDLLEHSFRTPISSESRVHS